MSGNLKERTQKDRLQKAAVGDGSSVDKLLQKKQRFVIGIDPGINCGFAVFDRMEKKLIACRSMQLWELFQTLRAWSSNNVEVFIENPNTWTNIGQGKVEGREQGAGAVKQSYKHITQFLDHLSVKYTATKLQGTMKKANAAKFKLITRWVGKTNEHSRDAALIVFNR